ncbi:hypothetical protein [Lactococcus petauri]|uniref:hypothetical protein n=1 Tax=Lactococcus petauri TaxID=1940789 RepID=UPI00254C1534|nr:hypothetical protein [Lactococcus petauri]
MARVRVKMPSKAKIKRDLTKAIRKNLVCFNCGRKLPSGFSSIITCPSCGAKTKLS